MKKIICNESGKSLVKQPMLVLSGREKLAQGYEKMTIASMLQQAAEMHLSQLRATWYHASNCDSVENCVFIQKSVLVGFSMGMLVGNKRETIMADGKQAKQTATVKAPARTRLLPEMLNKAVSVCMTFVMAFSMTPATAYAVGGGRSMLLTRR